jgi:hypothetical protein
MAERFKVGDRVQVKSENPGGTNRSPFFIRGKKGVVSYYHGLAGNPTDLSYGGTGDPALPLYCVSFHSAHLYDQDPDFVYDRVMVDVWEDWLEPVVQEAPAGPPIDRTEHELSYHEKRFSAIQGLIVKKGIMKTDEMRRLVAESDFEQKGTPHPMVVPS